MRLDYDKIYAEYALKCFLNKRTKEEFIKRYKHFLGIKVKGETKWTEK